MKNFIVVKNEFAWVGRLGFLKDSQALAERMEKHRAIEVAERMGASAYDTTTGETITPPSWKP